MYTRKKLKRDNSNPLWIQNSWLERISTIEERGDFTPSPTNTFLIFSVTVDVMTSKFCDFLFYLLATFLQNFMLRDSINSKLWYLCWDYIQFRYFSPVSMLCKISLCSLDIKATGSWNVVHRYLRAMKTKVNNHGI